MSTLDSLPVGTRAILGRATRMDATVFRLLEMGMSEGAVVTVTRRAPLGDPLEIGVRGTRLCLRQGDAARFPVRVERSTASRSQDPSDPASDTTREANDGTLGGPPDMR